MKRISIFAVLLVLLVALAAPAETAHNLLKQNDRFVAPYDLSVIPELLKSNANVFFVDNENTNASDAADGFHGETPTYPFKTYDYAVGQCTAGENNIIVVMPYSVERYTTAGSVDVDVSGITTIGLGYGPARPKFVFDHADATFVVGRDGDGATFQNITFQPSVTGVTVGVQHEDGADNISWIDCEWLDGEASVDEFVTAYDIVTEANDVSFERCRWTSMTAGATAGLDIGDGAVAGLRLIDCVMHGDWSTAWGFSDQALTRVEIDGCAAYNANADEYIFEFQGTANQGFCRNSVFVTSGNYVDAGGISLADNVYKAIGDSDTDGVTYSLGDNGITAAKIAADAITASELADNAIDAGAIAADAITAAKIATDAITSDELADSATAEIKTGVDPNAVLNDAPRLLVIDTNNFSEGAYQTADSPVTIATVTGDVLCRVIGIVTTACTSASNTGTLELGVVGDTACLLVQDVVDGTAFDENDCWSLTQAADTPSAELDGEWVVVPGGLDLDLTVATNNMTAGVIRFYVWWIPLSGDAAIVDAAP